MIRVGGVWLHTIAPVSGVVVTDRADGGCWSLEWQMSLPPGVMAPNLRAGDLVEFFDGAVRWRGELGTPDWDSGTFTADGLCRRGEEVAAVDTSGIATTHPGTAVGAAVARGALSWVPMTAFSAVAPVATEVNMISALLDEWCDERGYRWKVDERYALTAGADPTTPTLHVAPGLADLGSTTETQVTHLYGFYLDASLTYRQVVGVAPGAGSRRIERRVDLTNCGPLTPAQAQAKVDGILKKVGPLERLTSGVEVTEGQLLSAGGATLSLSLGRAGHMVRVHGVTDPRTRLPYTDFVVGESVWHVDEGRLILTPVEVVAGDLSSIVESMGGSLL